MALRAADHVAVQVINEAVMAFGIACLKHRVKWLGVIAFDFAGMLRIVVGSDALLVSQPAAASKA